MSNITPKLSFNKFIVKDSRISFYHINDFDINIDFKTTGLVLKSEKKFILLLETTITEKMESFNINIKSESIFDFSNLEDLELLMDSFFVVNAPAITFPYIRAYISGLTALSGLPTITLPTLNLTKIGESLKKNITIKD